MPGLNLSSSSLVPRLRTVTTFPNPSSGLLLLQRSVKCLQEVEIGKVVPSGQEVTFATQPTEALALEGPGVNSTQFTTAFNVAVPVLGGTVLLLLTGGAMLFRLYQQKRKAEADDASEQSDDVPVLELLDLPHAEPAPVADPTNRIFSGLRDCRFLRETFLFSDPKRTSQAVKVNLRKFVNNSDKRDVILGQFQIQDINQELSVGVAQLLLSSVFIL